MMRSSDRLLVYSALFAAAGFINAHYDDHIFAALAFFTSASFLTVWINIKGTKP